MLHEYSIGTINVTVKDEKTGKYSSGKIYIKRRETRYKNIFNGTYITNQSNIINFYFEPTEKVKHFKFSNKIFKVGTLKNLTKVFGKHYENKIINKKPITCTYFLFKNIKEVYPFKNFIDFQDEDQSVEIKILNNGYTELKIGNEKRKGFKINYILDGTENSTTEKILKVKFQLAQGILSDKKNTSSVFPKYLP